MTLFQKVSCVKDDLIMQIINRITNDKYLYNWISCMNGTIAKFVYQGNI
ncbi:hypothetical protein MUDAN_DOGOELCO_00596 [Lactiplantibacillus mudanjiangensis]|nr:hypothetical protein MUDAN_DOGOELCO_00596 [Lactiplantibacillus mudanjiangensis]